MWPRVEFVFWDDDRFYLGPTLTGLDLDSCIQTAWTSVLFEAYHPVHATLLCLELHALPEAASLVQRTSATGAILALLLGAAWVLLARELSLKPLAAVSGLMCAFAHPVAVELWMNAAAHKDLLGLVFFVFALALSRGGGGRSVPAPGCRSWCCWPGPASRPMRRPAW